VEVLELSVSIEAAPDSLPEPGGPVDFTVVFTNTGSKLLTLTSLQSTLYGNLMDSGNSAISGTTCDDPLTINPNGGVRGCSFSANVSGQPGDVVVSVSAAMEDNQGNEVSHSGQTTVTLTDVPSSIDVTLTADPSSVPEPRAAVDFTVRVENTSPVDSVTINSLNDSLLGNLDGQGTCTIPQTNAAGNTYQCSFTATVSGSSGDNETNTVTAAGSDDDGSPVSASDQTSVAITDSVIKYVYLPLALNNFVIGEPNDGPCQAYPINLNHDYYFLPDDENDWYQFELPSSGNVVVELTDFAPLAGQILVYHGDSCNSLTSDDLLGNNGDFSPTKIVSFSAPSAGTYYVWVINDGAINATHAYKLRIQFP
jgi:hypothetical protein